MTSLSSYVFSSFFRAYNFYYRLTRRHWRFDFRPEASEATPNAAQYASVSFLQTRRAIEALGDVDRLTFYDIGCGKGNVLLVAAEFPFRRIVGIELFRQFATAAVRNVQHRVPRTGEPEISIVCADAREIDYPSEPAAFYFFNPFPPAVFEEVLDQIEASYEGQKLYVIVVHPVGPGYLNALRERAYRPWRVLNHDFSRTLIYEHT
jgi:SAM-dependent methyltransferase